MPSVFSHAAFSWAMGFAVPKPPAQGRFLWAVALCSVVPDLDTVGLALGVPYGSVWGHRGITHSLAFAAVLGVAIAWMGFRRDVRGGRLWALGAFFFVATASHPFFDMLTDGGLGVALLAPLDTTRYFFPWRPIRVSPIGAGFFSVRGAAVFASELVWVWIPAAVVALAGRILSLAARAKGKSL